MHKEKIETTTEHTEGHICLVPAGDDFAHSYLQFLSRSHEGVGQMGF